jgi:hypothetical protein
VKVRLTYVNPVYFFFFLVALFLVAFFLPAFLAFFYAATGMIDSSIVCPGPATRVAPKTQTI